MEDRSNIIKEAIEYRDKLEKKVEELAQSVVRLQISLDFADNTIKKKDKEIAELKVKIKKYAAINEQETKDYAELKAENARLKSCLQEIKRILILHKQELEECLYSNIDDKILDLITKAESEG